MAAELPQGGTSVFEQEMKRGDPSFVQLAAGMAWLSGVYRFDLCVWGTYARQCSRAVFCAGQGKRRDSFSAAFRGK